MLRLLLTASLLAACAPAPAPDAGATPSQTATEPAARADVLSGTVTYRPRVALRPDAVATVRLLDVSRADAPAGVLAETVVPVEGRQVPLPFRLRYDASSLDAQARYAVRAQIRDRHGALLWTSDTAVPVLTRGAPLDGVEIVVVRPPVEGGGGVGVPLPLPPGDPASGESKGGGAVQGSEGERLAPMHGEASGRTLVYACPGGPSFTTRAGPGELAVWLPEALGLGYRVLGQVRAASGARYSDGELTVWTQGDTALIESAGARWAGCTVDAEASARARERLEGVDLEAAGQEPGWWLAVREGERITFAYDYGRQRVEAAAPAAQRDAQGRTVYRAQTSTHALVVTVEAAPCHDSMSGEPYEATVTVTLGEQTYRGCGRRL